MAIFAYFWVVDAKDEWVSDDSGQISIWVRKANERPRQDVLVERSKQRMAEQLWSHPANPSEIRHQEITSQLAAN